MIMIGELTDAISKERVGANITFCRAHLYRKFASMFWLILDTAL